MLFLSNLKNTFLLFILILSSCGKKVQSVKKNIETALTKDIVIPKPKIIVAANRTNAYIPLLKDKKIAVVANQTSVIFKKTAKEKPKYTHLVDSLISLHVNVKKVFSPEHGFRGKVDAGETVKDGLDAKTGLPIISLYGKNKKPSAKQLQDIDIVIFDIQDVGVRFYTYISTLQLVMEACAQNNIPILVLDRPNPNAHYVDGPTMEAKHTSFLGMTKIPLVYGMTIGEYATMINEEGWLTNSLKANLSVIPLKNYTHKTEYSLPIRPSPNLPNDMAIKLYPSLGLFEGTNVNAGRGTEFQFQRFGAPFLNADYYDFKYTPEPNFGAKNPKQKGKLCYGMDLTKINSRSLNGVLIHWVAQAYENTIDKELFFNTNGFTKHAGTEKLQQQIEAGVSFEDISRSWDSDIKDFKKIRVKYLIYK